MSPTNDRPILVIGGAGFIGSNVASHLLRSGKRVRIFDDLSRPGVERNLAWLRTLGGGRVETELTDVCNRAAVRASMRDCQAVFHFAAQVAVTTSLSDPRADFEVNAGGTLEVLEAARTQPTPPPVIFTSTNKVYGCLPDLAMRVEGDRWVPTDPDIASRGIDERRPLEFRTPYGCSKGCADQYVLDYAHSYGVPTAVFRMSCIYGPRQFGTEDQGWVAHFLIRAMEDAPITIYGDGRQVRDVLFIDDLVDALMRAWANIGVIRGSAFNIGGGVANTLSLRELLAMIEKLRGAPVVVQHEGWRPGDQRYYVSDTSAFTGATGWKPTTSPHAGVEALHGWLVAEAANPPTASTTWPGVIRA